MATKEPSAVVESQSQGSLGRALKFSLVLATIGRTTELSNFLSHLDCQSYRNFELLVVDQNPDDRLTPILAPYRNRFAIKHVKSDKGLSRARNIGLQHVTGDVVAFPDDDCWYRPNTLQYVATAFQANLDWDGLAGRCDGTQAYYFLDRQAGYIDEFNVWRRAISVAIFLRTSTVRLAGEFDPYLGSGSEAGFNGGEEIDFLLCAIKRKCRIYYEPKLVIDHPDVPLAYDREGIRKACSYARGMGYIFKKHHYPLWYFDYFLLRPLGGMVLEAARSNFPKVSFHLALLKGRLSGWISGPIVAAGRLQGPDPPVTTRRCNPLARAQTSATHSAGEALNRDS